MIDVLSVVTAATRRTIGEADVGIWSAIIADLPQGQCFRTVKAHLAECPGVWLEPGHVRQRVRTMLRDRLQRESRAEFDARQAAIDARLVPRIAELAASSAVPGPAVEPKFKRPEHNALAVACPWCKRPTGHHCVVSRTKERPAGGAHPARIAAADAMAGAR